MNAFCFAGLTIQATILAYMFSLLENGKITVTLAPSSGPTMQNVPYIQQFLMNLLKAAFPHLNEYVFKQSQQINVPVVEYCGI